MKTVPSKNANIGADIYIAAKGATVLIANRDAENISEKKSKKDVFSFFKISDKLSCLYIMS